MIQDLEQIEYRQGLLDKKMKPDSLVPKVWRLSKIPRAVRKAILEYDLLNLGGVHGKKVAAGPNEYDELKLILTDDTVKIVVWNRSNALMSTDDEKVKRIHGVLNLLNAPEMHR